MRNAIVCGLLVCAACGSKKDDRGAGAGAPPAPSAPTDPAAGGGGGGAPAPAPAGSMVAASPAMIDVDALAANARRTRIFDCVFVRYDGEDKDRKTVFKLTNHGDRAAESAQSWLFYYDKADKLLGRYPHRFPTSLPPGAAEEQALGHAGARIPKDAATVECEISEVYWKDKTAWSNANLYSNSVERPRGGLSTDQLLAREGEHVTATWTGKVEELPVLALENVTTRPLTATVVWIYQYDERGEPLERSVSNVSIDLEPGARVEQKLGPKALEPGAKHIEASVPEVRFRDGNKELWRNDNLAPLERPMKGPRAAPPAPPTPPTQP